MSKTQLFFLFYILLSISVIGVQLAHFDSVQNVLKPLLMPTLIVGYFWLKNNKLKKYDYQIIIALFFSMLGDSFLMPYFNIFMAGLASFLVAHIFYIIAFIPEVKKPISIDRRKVLFASIGFALYVILVATLFWKLTAISASIVLFFAIGIYATVLLSMFIAALLRNTSSKLSYNLILIGAALFLLSDGLLAFNKFVVPIPLSSLWVIGSYTAAQAFIVYGSLKR